MGKRSNINYKLNIKKIWLIKSSELIEKLDKNERPA